MIDSERIDLMRRFGRLNLWEEEFNNVITIAFAVVYNWQQDNKERFDLKKIRLEEIRWPLVTE